MLRLFLLVLGNGDGDSPLGGLDGRSRITDLLGEKGNGVAIGETLFRLMSTTAQQGEN